TDNTNFRRNLDSWFESEGIRPDIIGEFEDYALLRTFGHAGAGVFPVPVIFEKQLRREDGLKHIGSTNKVRTSFYAISGERKIEHPAVVAICDTARRQLFGEGKSFSKVPPRSGGAKNRPPVRRGPRSEI